MNVQLLHYIVLIYQKKTKNLWVKWMRLVLVVKCK